MATEKATRPRLSGDERRALFIEAAITEFGARGYHATRTTDIAARAGVTQPYLYALFPDKRSLFLACHERTTALIRQTLRDAAAAQHPDDGLELHARIGRAVTRMTESHPEHLRFYFQARAAAATDPDIRATVRRNFMAIVDDSVELHGAPRQEVLRYIAWAMLHDVAVALDLPQDYRPQI